MSKSRTGTIQLALVALAAVFVALILPLIGNIQHIEFRPGYDFAQPVSIDSARPSPMADPHRWTIGLPIIRILFVIFAIGVLIAMITNREARKTYIVFALVAIASLIAIELLVRNRQQPERVDTEVITSGPVEPWHISAEDERNLRPMEPETEPSMAQYIILAIALSSVVVIVAVIILLKWLKSRRQEEDGEYAELIDSITDAAHRIRAGEDPHSVVLFCYQEMVRILSIKGRIDATYLTPREFEIRLRGGGLSDEHITHLTGIFEIVRYGGRIDEGFAARALACLDAVSGDYAIAEQ